MLFIDISVPVENTCSAKQSIQKSRKNNSTAGSSKKTTIFKTEPHRLCFTCSMQFTKVVCKNRVTMEIP